MHHCDELVPCIIHKIRIVRNHNHIRLIGVFEEFEEKSQHGILSYLTISFIGAELTSNPLTDVLSYLCWKYP